MTIPAVVMHSNQQMYIFDSVIEGASGPLAKFTCLYCGGGDYILTGIPSNSLLMADTVDSSAFDYSVTEQLPCCEETQVGAVPEPGTFVLLVIALVLGIIGAGLRGHARELR